MQNKNFLSDIVFLRAISIVFVVAFHAYGMMYAAAHFPALKDTYYQMYFTLNQCVFINIAMPMFIFVSGYLFAFLRQKGKYQNFVDLAKNKAKRILLPYFVFGLIMMATTNNFHPLALFYGNYWHLWFLPMLFWCFIVTYLIHPFIMNNRAWVAILTLLVLFAISLVGKVVPMIIGVHNVHLWICWFAFGTWFCSHEHLITKGFSQKFVIVCGISIYVIISYFVPWEYGNNNLMGTIATLGGILALWSMANILFPLDYWAIEHTTLFPLIFSLMAFIISWGLTWLLLKTRFGKFLIG